MGKISNTEKAQSRGRCPGDMKVPRPRRLYQRRQTERSEQHENAPDGPRLFACPFAKHDPSAVPRSCFLGWHSMARVKEHLGRRHKTSPSETYCNETPFTRCNCDVSKCDACKMKGLQLNEDASRMLQCRSPDSPETWYQLYYKIYPHAINTPSPFIEHHAPPQKTVKDAIQEFSQILCDRLGDVFPSTNGLDYDAVLIRPLRDYILSQKQRYIEGEQHEGSESSRMSWAESDVASLGQSPSYASSKGLTPQLAPNMDFIQDPLDLPAPVTLLENPLASQQHDLPIATNAYSRALVPSRRNTTATSEHKNVHQTQSLPLWPTPAASSTLASFSTDVSKLVSTENSSPDSSIQTRSKLVEDYPSSLSSYYNLEVGGVCYNTYMEVGGVCYNTYTGLTYPNPLADPWHTTSEEYASIPY